MTYQTPAPRYARPIPASKLPPIVRDPRPTFLDALDNLAAAGRVLRAEIITASRVNPLLDRLSAALEREQEDRMLRIGGALGILAALALTAALASI